MTDNGTPNDKKLYTMTYSTPCSSLPIKYSSQSKQTDKTRDGIPHRSRTDSETQVTASTSMSIVSLEEEVGTQGCRSDENIRICQSISSSSSMSKDEFENDDGLPVRKFVAKISKEYAKPYEESRDEEKCENKENESDPDCRTFENRSTILPTDAEAWLAGGKRELVMHRVQNDETIHESNVTIPVLEARSSVSSPQASSLRNKLQNRILKRQEFEKIQWSQSDLSSAISKKATHGSLDSMKEILRTSSSDSQPTSPTSDSGLSMAVDPHEKRKVPDTNSNGGPNVLLYRLHRTVRYSRKGELPQQRREYANTVRLHIYDLLANDTIMQLPFGCEFPIGKCFVTMNDGLHAVGTGAYHCGIEVNGVEYAFGANEMVGSTGVFTCVPRRAPGYEYRATIDYGSRVVRKTQWVNVRRDPSNVNYSSKGDSYVYRQIECFLIGRQLMKEMASEYRGTDYDLLHKNCCTFAYDACLRLGIDREEIPTWFKNLSDTGAQTQTIAQSAMSVFSMASCGTSQEKPDPRDVQVGGFEVVGTSTGVKVIDIEKQAEVKISRGVSEHGVRRTLSWTY